MRWTTSNAVTLAVSNYTKRQKCLSLSLISCNILLTDIQKYGQISFINVILKMHKIINKPQCPNSSVCGKFLLFSHSQYSSHLSFLLIYLWEHLLKLEALHLLDKDISPIYKIITCTPKLVLNNAAIKIKQIATWAHIIQISGVTYNHSIHQIQNVKSLLHLKLSLRCPVFSKAIVWISVRTLYLVTVTKWYAHSIFFWVPSWFLNFFR